MEVSPHAYWSKSIGYFDVTRFLRKLFNHYTNLHTLYQKFILQSHNLSILNLGHRDFLLHSVQNISAVRAPPVSSNFLIRLFSESRISESSRAFISLATSFSLRKYCKETWASLSLGWESTNLWFKKMIEIRANSFLSTQTLRLTLFLRYTQVLMLGLKP